MGQNMIRRREDWPSRLAAFIQSKMAEPFVWGVNDCCLLTGSAIQAMTGIDPASDFRGKYKSRRGAFARMKRFAGGGVLETAQKIASGYGWPEIPVSRAQRGDAVLISISGAEPLLAFVDTSGRQAAVIQEDAGGLAFVPLAHAVRAWKVA